MMRVPTRFWFILFLVAIYLAGYYINILESKVSKSASIIIFCFVIVEYLALSWTFLSKPYSQRATVPNETYNYLESNTERFRVLCISRCLAQDESAKHKLELVEGYSTLTQLNYFEASRQLTGGYWDYYALPTPPTGVYKFQNLQPDAKSTAEYNVAYIVSPHELVDDTLILDKKFGEYYVYKNPLVKPRANAPITLYSPNLIRVDTSSMESSQVILSEVYSPGWRAYLDGVDQVTVQETPISLRAVDVKPDTKFVDFVYLPKSYVIGRAITLGTIFLLVAYYFIKKWRC